LFTARSARNWMAAGEKPAKGGAASANSEVLRSGRV
jgi:hypothetical protein